MHYGCGRGTTAIVVLEKEETVHYGCGGVKTAIVVMKKRKQCIMVVEGQYCYRGYEKRNSALWLWKGQ